MYHSLSNVLFIHIPKCAGQSICNFFLNSDDAAWDDRDKYLMFQNGDPKYGPPQIAHLTLNEYRASSLLTNETINNAVKFAVVRNPWDRLWSEYNFNWKHICSWGEFFNYFPDYIFDDHKTGRDAKRHILPQVEFIDETVNVLRFENLLIDFTWFCQMYDIPYTHQLSHLNASKSQSYHTVYKPFQRDVVSEYYLKDIQAFGYKAP